MASVHTPPGTGLMPAVAITLNTRNNSTIRTVTTTPSQPLGRSRGWEWGAPTPLCPRRNRNREIQITQGESHPGLSSNSNPEASLCHNALRVPEGSRKSRNSQPFTSSVCQSLGPSSSAVPHFNLTHRFLPETQEHLPALPT